MSSSVQSPRAAGTRRALAAGEVLVTEGDRGDQVWWVLDGCITASTTVDGRAVQVGSYGPGAVLGELAGLTGGVRAATLAAAEPSVVEEVTAAAHTAWLAAEPERARELAQAALRRLDQRSAAVALAPMLEDPAAAAELLAALSWRRLDPGEVLWRAGEHGTTAALIVSGAVRLDRSAAGAGRRAGFGAVLGARVLAGHPIRQHTAVAERPTALAVLDRADLLHLVDRHPSLAMDLARGLASPRTGARPPAGARAPAGSPGGVRVGSGASGTTTVAVAELGGGNQRALASRIAAVAGTAGTATHWWRARVDAVLGPAGVADAPPDHPMASRMEHFLREVEADADVVVLELDGVEGGWTRRAIGRADVLLVVLHRDADDDAVRRAAALVARAGAGTETWLAVRRPPGDDAAHGSAALHDRTGAQHVTALRDGVPGDVERVARLVTGNGVGLVLSGGGARGFAHLGVHRAMVELGIPVDRIAGASIGSVIGGLLAFYDDPAAIQRHVEEDFRGLLDYTVPLVSLVKGERIAAAIGRRAGERDLRDAARPLQVVVTNLSQATSEVLDRGSVHHAVRASVAIPGVLPPVPRGEDLLVDGGLMDNFPVAAMRAHRSIRTVIGVDVTPSRGPRARRDFGLSVSGWRVLADRVRATSQGHPALAMVLMASMQAGATRARDDAVAAGIADLVVNPDLRGIGLLEFDRVAEVAQAGYEASRPILERWWEPCG